MRSEWERHREATEGGRRCREAAIRVLQNPTDESRRLASQAATAEVLAIIADENESWRFMREKTPALPFADSDPRAAGIFRQRAYAVAVNRSRLQELALAFQDMRRLSDHETRLVVSELMLRFGQAWGVAEWPDFAHPLDVHAWVLSQIPDNPEAFPEDDAPGAKRARRSAKT